MLSMVTFREISFEAEALDVSNYVGYKVSPVAVSDYKHIPWQLFCTIKIHCMFTVSDRNSLVTV